MTENKSNCLNNSCGKENACIDVSRILDSCRDKDCFEDVKVYLDACGKEIISSSGSVRAKKSKILAANINVEPVPFNRGFYQIFIRYFVRITCEACSGINKRREFEGLAVCDKNVILYGSEGNVSIFKSETGFGNTLSCSDSAAMSTNLPTVCVEVIDPIILNTRTGEKNQCCCCCCSIDEIPGSICDMFDGDLSDGDEKDLFVSLGFFSVIRIERPGQYIVSASEFSVPDKECVMTQPDDPCQMFAKMSFPTGEFSPPSIPIRRKDRHGEN